ncbi:hypothetical protein KAR91_03285, partial [Candidatus Pacearchaeota archaeon]|nr:hypothetical protein [Candidatus Pacearchaeota archaeon]
MFWLITAKKEVKKIQSDTKKGFESVKKDMGVINGWIKHLSTEKDSQGAQISDLRALLSTAQEEIEGLKNIVSVMNDLQPKQAFKTAKRLTNKQTAVYDIQTGVQSGVQTPKLSDFSVTERAILWILLNDERKLSYDDLAAILGKERSTIRGQINTIKQKNNSVIDEVIEKNGKKRVYISTEIKEKMLKKAKV